MVATKVGSNLAYIDFILKVSAEQKLEDAVETQSERALLGLDNLETALRFYRDGLGLATEGIIGTEFEHGAVAFFDLQPGLKLALFPRESLAIDAKIAVTPRSPSEFSIGHNVNSKAEVDVVMLQAEKAGAKILKPAGDVFWGGYTGYFLDPDDHLWEVVWNPTWQIPD